MEQGTRLHLDKEDKQLRNYTAWKNIYRQLVESHLQFSKSLQNVAVFAETAFKDDQDTPSSIVMIDMGRILINELKSQSKAIKDQWEGYNKDKTPFDFLDSIDGKMNRTLYKQIADICSERKQLEQKVKRAQKKFFRSYDMSRALVEEIQVDEFEGCHKEEMKAQLTTLKSKTDVYLAKYKAIYQNEYDSRESFITKMNEIQNKWSEKEKENMEIWTTAGENLCSRLDKSCPRIFKAPLNDESPYPAIMRKFNNLDLDDLVVNTLYSKLEEYYFPVYMERRMEDIVTPPSSSTCLNNYTPDPDLMQSFAATTSRPVRGNPFLTEETLKPTKERREGKRATNRKQDTHQYILDMAIPVEDYVGAKHESQNNNSDSSSSDNDVEIIGLHDANRKEVLDTDNSKSLKVIVQKGQKDPDLMPSDIAYDNTVPVIRKHNWQDVDDTGDDDEDEKDMNCSRHARRSPDLAVSNMKNVDVSAIKSYIKKGKEEMDLEIGMIIKQKKPANDKGMAYGWYKKKRMGVKKYGFYPVDHVVFIQTSS